MHAKINFKKTCFSIAQIQKLMDLIDIWWVEQYAALSDSGYVPE